MCRAREETALALRKERFLSFHLCFVIVSVTVSMQFPGSFCGFVSVNGGSFRAVFTAPGNCHSSDHESFSLPAM
jgi:hypothetical protein